MTYHDFLVFDMQTDVFCANGVEERAENGALGNAGRCRLEMGHSFDIPVLSLKRILWVSF